MVLTVKGKIAPARYNLVFTGSGQTFPGFAGIFIASMAFWLKEPGVTVRHRISSNQAWQCLRAWSGYHKHLIINLTGKFHGETV
jgi:hypothetical protein